MPRLIALLVAVLVLTGCAAPGSAAHAMPFGGLDRGYRLYVPDG